MTIIGLTGGSGAGKTAVSVCFQALGAGTVDADAVYRNLCAGSRPMLETLAAAFGDVLTPEGALDRPKLAYSQQTDVSIHPRRIGGAVHGTGQKRAYCNPV